MSDQHSLPVISLWNPWASWVIRGWKEIETRLHARFAILEGQWVGIHAAKRWDEQAIYIAEKWLTAEQVKETKRFFRLECGALLGAAHVCWTGVLRGENDSRRALIDCEHTRRYGLAFDKVAAIDPVLIRGHQGIFRIEKENFPFLVDAILRKEGEEQ